jgi:hypothetical protein
MLTKLSALLSDLLSRLFEYKSGSCLSALLSVSEKLMCPALFHAGHIIDLLLGWMYFYRIFDGNYINRTITVNVINH